MATTNSQVFYPTAATIDQTFTGAGVIRAILASAPAADATTKVTYTTTAANQLRTFTYGTTSTTASDTTQNNGWAYNNSAASTDSLGSTATTQRVFPAGTWTFDLSLSFTAPATTTTASATVTVKVYRAAISGGARTLLFQQAFAASTATAAQTNAITITSSQPRYLLGAGEVLEIGYLCSSQATETVAGVTGAVANTITFNLGSGSKITVPTPGIRTQTNSNQSITSLNTLSKRINVGINRTITNVNTVTLIKRGTFFRVFSVTSTNTVTMIKNLVFNRRFTITSTNTLRTFVMLAITNLPVSGGGNTIIKKVQTFIFDD